MEGLRRSKRTCVMKMKSLQEEKKQLPEVGIYRFRKTRLKRKLNTIKTRNKTKKKRSESIHTDDNKRQEIELCDLSEEVLILILENVSAPGLINMSKTSWLFHRLCKTDTLWRHRCKVDFNLVTKWIEFSHLYLYEMFFKASTLRDDQNFFKPVSQLKTSVIVWYLVNPIPPCHVVGHLTASQVKSIWGITEDELEEMYFDDTEDRPEVFPLCHYDWSRLYQVFVRKHGGVVPMQNYVLKRCFRNRQALEEHYKLSLHASRRQKWYKYLEDRDVGNRDALKALTMHMPKVTYLYMLHQITAMYIDGNLKGGFQTVKAYAEFCALFKNWLQDKSMNVWPPRLGEILAQDYRDALDYVNKSLAQEAEERELDVESFMRRACPFIEKMHEIWVWQNQHGTSYRKEHRSSMIVRRHDCFRKYLEMGRTDDFAKLRMYFERREVLSHWLKENLWLISLLGDAVVRSLRPPMLTPEFTFPVLGNDPVACLVQRFLETGLYIDFNKIRMKLSELSSMQLHALFKKSQGLERVIMNDSHLHYFQKSRFPPLNQPTGGAAIMPPMHPPYQMFFPPTNFFHCTNNAQRFR